MKKHKTNKLRRRGAKYFAWPGFLLAFFLYPLLFSSCYEAVEGCLDTNALNFSLDADRACDGCCTYPGLSVRLVHLWSDADTTFTFRYTSDAFRDGGGHPFAIDRITYYLHDFVLETSTGSTVETTDSVLVAFLNDAGGYEDTNIQDDYLLVNAGLSSALAVGTLERNGTFTRLRFDLGVDAFTDRILPGSLPGNHPLSLLDTTMYDLSDGRYRSSRFDLRRGAGPDAADLLLTYGAERPVIPVVVEIPGGFALPAGFSVEFTIEVNYAEWFRNVGDIRTAAESEILDQIVGGIPNAFRLLEISINQR